MEAAFERLRSQKTWPYRPADLLHALPSLLGLVFRPFCILQHFLLLGFRLT